MPHAGDGLKPARGIVSAAEPDRTTPKTRPSNALLWAVVGASAFVNLATGLFPDVGPPALQAALLTVPLLAFGFMHGAVAYGARDIVIFAVLCVLVSNAIENLNVLTGFPFGSLHYSEKLGPKLFFVPILIGPAYFAVGYPSWMLARVLLGVTKRKMGRHAVVTLPLMASFLMVSWNLTFDPLVSTLRGVWIWQEGGHYFGVPVTNFIGWYLTAYVFFQLFALYRRYRPGGLADEAPESRQFWLQPAMIYGSIAAMAVLTALTIDAAGSVVDQAGAEWRIGDIYAVCALVSVFTMGAFTALAVIRVAAMQHDGLRSSMD